MKNNSNAQSWITKLLVTDRSANSISIAQAMLLHIFLILGALVCIMPFFFLFTTAFKTFDESIRIPLQWFPANPSFDAFQGVFTKLPFASMFFNSVITTMAITAFQIVLSAMAGFALALLDIPRKNLILFVILAILMIPPQAYLIPQFLIIVNVRLLNTLAAIILPNAFSAFGIFLFRQAFLSLPYSLYEAAVLDGCNPMRIFWSVMFPLVKPTIGAFGVLAALFGWNNLLWPLIVNSAPNKSTLAVGMLSLIGERFIDYPKLMAGASIVLVPMIVVFIAMRRYLLSGTAYLGNK